MYMFLATFFDGYLHFMASDISGIQVLTSDNEKGEQGSTSEPEEISASFINPFDLAIDISEEDSLSDAESDSDEDYEPSINITIRPANSAVLGDVSFAEAEFGDQLDDSGDEDTSTPEADVT